MTDTIQSRLDALGLTIPQAAAPVASYVTTVKTGNLLFVSGQVPLVDGKLEVQGKVGAEVDVATAQKAAEICALNILAQAKAALGSLDKIRRVVKLTVFVAADPAFTGSPEVANGASDLFIKVLGDEVGKHARSAVGVAVLPRDVPVEVEAILEIERRKDEQK